jgi:hypothetical protein
MGCAFLYLELWRSSFDTNLPMQGSESKHNRQPFSSTINAKERHSVFLVWMKSLWRNEFGATEIPSHTSCSSAYMFERFTPSPALISKKLFTLLVLKYNATLSWKSLDFRFIVFSFLDIYSKQQGTRLYQSFLSNFLYIYKQNIFDSFTKLPMCIYLFLYPSIITLLLLKNKILLHIFLNIALI